MNKKISLATSTFPRYYSLKDTFTLVKKAGADAVDLDLSAGRFDIENPNSVYAKSEDEFCTFFTDLKRHADDIELEVGQTHGRIIGYYVDMPEEFPEKHTKNARLDCYATKLLGAPVTVFHGSNSFRNPPEKATAEQMRSMTFDMFRNCIPFAREFGIKIATETFGRIAQLGGIMDFFGDLGEFQMMYNRLCAIEDFKNHFTMCMDTGHTNMCTLSGYPSPADAIRILGSNITCLHLHDNPAVYDRHMLPGTGNIDWKAVLTALDDIGYKGNYNLELSLGFFGENADMVYATAQFGVKIMRNMLKEHYGEI